MCKYCITYSYAYGAYYFYVNLSVILIVGLMSKVMPLTIYSPIFSGVEHCALLHIIVMHIGPIISM